MAPPVLAIARVRRVMMLALTLLAACNRSTDGRAAATQYHELALRHARFTWDSVSAPGFTLYTLRGSYGAARAAQYRAEIEQGIAHALGMLNERTYPARLRLFVMSSRDDVEAVTGTGWNGWTDAPGNNAAVVARSECRPVLRHEIMHAVSLRLWGHPLGTAGDPAPPQDPVRMAQGGWLREGIAAAAEDLYLTYSYRGMAAQWLAEGTIFPLDTLMNHFYEVDDLAAYLQAGSLVRYLLDQYGVDRFRAIWRDGVDAVPRVYGKTPGEIEAEWHAWLRATPSAARPASIRQARSEDHCPGRR